MSDNKLTLESIKARREYMAEEAKLLDAVDEAVNALEAFYAREGRSTEAETAANTDAPKRKRLVLHRPPKTRKTKNDYILEALSEPRDLWQTGQNIREYVEIASGKPVKMPSISPALSDLKNGGVIQREDLKVALTKRLRNEQSDFFGNEGSPRR